MKVAIMSFSDPYTTPYINIYLELISKSDIKYECDIIYWKRNENLDEMYENVNYIPSSWTAEGLKKYYGYIKTTLLFYKCILKNKYDKIIFLQTHAAVASSLLLKKYRNKYVIDIRDYTLESHYLYRIVEKKLIENSFMTILSSPSYTSFLPEYDYNILHNYSELRKNENIEIKNNEEPINISFIGSVRFYEIAKRILNVFKNDERFWISYIGTGANKLKHYCEENEIYNITLIDTFEPKDTLRFYEKCNIVNNLYGNNSKYLDYALSNKLYYSAQLQIPLLVSPKTYSETVAIRYNLGFSVDIDNENAKEEVYEKYSLFDYEKMRELSKEFLDNVKNENNNTLNKLACFFKEIENES